RVWQADTGKDAVTLQGNQEKVATVAFSPDGKSLASGGYDRQIHVYDLTTAKQKFQVQAHAIGGRSLAYSPDGRWIVSGGEDSTPRLWKANEAAAPAVSVPARSGSVHQVAFNPDGKSFAICGADNLIRLYALNGVEGRTLQGHTRPVTSL